MMYVDVMVEEGTDRMDRWKVEVGEERIRPGRYTLTIRTRDGAQTRFYGLTDVQLRELAVLCDEAIGE